MTGNAFNRKGDLVNDPTGAQIVFVRAPHGRLLGDVRDHYRDEDGNRATCGNTLQWRALADRSACGACVGIGEDICVR